MNLLRKITHNERAKVIINNYKDIIEPSDKIIDMGSYTGFIAKKISDFFNCVVECADITNNLDYEMNFHLIKNFKTDIPDKSFDIAMINDTLHHIPKDKQLLMVKEAERIAKKVLIFESKYSFIIEITERLDEGNMPCPRTHRNLEEWKDLLKDFKYNKVKKPYYYPVKNYIFVNYQHIQNKRV